MLEVTGVVLGALPLISMAFRLFREVQTLLVEYKHLDRHMQSALRDIYSAKCLFMRAMDEFLKDIVEEERLKHMLDDLDDDGWNLEDLDLKLCVELGPLSEAVTNSLRGMIETMQDVKSVLNLTGEAEQAVPHLVTAASNTANSPATTSSASRLSPQRYLTRFLRRGREVESMQFTPGEKCKHVSKGALQELRKLREAMRSHNGEIQLALIIHRKPGPSVQLIPAGPVQPVPGTSAASVAGVNTRHLDPRKIQIASKQLHRIVCNAPSISCPCHLLHLRLGNKKGETPIVNPVGEARIEFSFVMTNDYHTCSNTEIPALDLAFTSQDLSRANNIHMETQLRPDTMLCKELLTSDDAYERYFCDPGSNQGCNPGFLLRRKIPQPISSTVISLDDVITTTKLYPFDQYLIAANLANSVLYHYSSPWIRNWTTKTILFFDRHAETAPLWMPHIPVHFASNQDQLDFSDRNKELYVLGLILLQLGHGECAEPIHDESMMQRALSGLCMTLGRRYKQVVENFLRKGSDRSVDLMEVDNLEEFQAAIDMLKNLVDDHTPDIESSSVLARGN